MSRTVSAMLIMVVYGLVCLCSCATTRSTSIQPTVYMPAGDDGTYSYYLDGQPLVEVNGESYSMLMSLEPVEVAGDIYMRLWVLYKNDSDEAVMFDPGSFGTLSTERTSGRVEVANAESPTRILDSITAEENAKVIAQIFGGALLAASRQSPSNSDADNYYIEQNEVHNAAASIEGTERWYGIYKTSVDSGILRRNTVFPGTSINGFIYYPFAWSRKPGRGGDFSVTPKGMRYLSASEYKISKEFRHQLEFRVGQDSRVLLFSPIAGE